MTAAASWGLGAPNYKRVYNHDNQSSSGLFQSFHMIKHDVKMKQKEKKKKRAGFTNQRQKDDSTDNFFSGVLDTFCSPCAIEVANVSDEDSLHKESVCRDEALFGMWGTETASEEEVAVPEKRTRRRSRTKTVSLIDKMKSSEHYLTVPQIAAKNVNVKSTRPSIYEEALEMLTHSLLIYTFADVQKMIQEGVIESDELAKTPIPLTAIMDAIRVYKQALESRATFDHGDLESRLIALKDIKTKEKQSSTVIGRILGGSMPRNSEPILAHFHDEISTQGLVYGISLNPLCRRVTVIFRGSVTKEDFITNIRFAQKKVANPVLSLAPEATKTINIHTGFYQYLFQEDDDGKVRLHHILDSVKKLLKKNKGYQLFCTGHSLGGALCTLFGFYAALDNYIVKNGPVCVYSIASPRIGNFDFRASFRILERMRRLQHLRISNKGDVVTLLPFVAVQESSISPELSLYKHCGIHLKLKPTFSGGGGHVDPDRLFKISYAKDRNDEYEGVNPDELKQAVNAGKSSLESLLVSPSDLKNLTSRHSCVEYERRLMACSEHLDILTLHHLYGDKSLVGDVATGANEEETAKKTKMNLSTIRFFPERDIIAGSVDFV